MRQSYLGIAVLFIVALLNAAMFLIMSHMASVVDKLAHRIALRCSGRRQ